MRQSPSPKQALWTRGKHCSPVPDRTVGPTAVTPKGSVEMTVCGSTRPGGEGSQNDPSDLPSRSVASRPASCPLKACLHCGVWIEYGCACWLAGGRRRFVIKPERKPVEARGQATVRGRGKRQADTAARRTKSADSSVSSTALKPEHSERGETKRRADVDQGEKAVSSPAPCLSLYTLRSDACAVRWPRSRRARPSRQIRRP